MKNKLIPSLWFHTSTGKIGEVIDYYKNIFGEAMTSEEILALGNTPSGYAERCFVSIFDNKYFFMSTEIEHNSFNDSLGFLIECSNQNEIDLYWNYFTKEGKEVVCGWCIDKYVLRWQIVPNNLWELINKPNGQNVLMNQKKIIIEEYLA